MSTMTTEAMFVVITPDAIGWLVTVNGDTVTFRDPITMQSFRWNDEDEIVEGIENGSVDDEEWLDAHNDWSA